MKRTVVLLSALLLAGCVTPPQTVEELRVGVKSGAAMTKIEQKEIKRPFAATFHAIKRHANKCLNVAVTGSTPGRYGPVVESVRYRSHSKMTSHETGEMILQMDKKATGKMPPGGYYVMLTDIERTAKNITKVTVYGASFGYGKVFDSIFAWARGRSKKCPKFPMSGLGQSFTYHNK